MKIDNNKPIEVQDYLARKIKSVQAKHGFKIDLEYLKRSKLGYLNTIKPIKYNTPQFGNHNYDSLLRYCCLSIVTETRFVPSGIANLPDLWLHVGNNKAFQNICISKLTDHQLCNLHNILVQEHINIEVLREKSVIDRLIVDFFRNEKALGYTNWVLNNCR